MSDNFDRALAYTLGEEGGYATLADDEVTNRGVKKTTWEDWVGHQVSNETMRNLSFQDVKPLYEARYWKAAYCPLLYFPLDLCVFDFAVHSGPRTAVLELQKVVGTKADGQIGEKTLKAIDEIQAQELIKRYMQARLKYAQKSRRWTLYRNGWTTRFNRLEKYALAQDLGRALK